MNDYNIKDLFARLFVLAIQNKINFYSFTHHLERSEFVSKIEENEYDDYFNKDILTIFFDITKNHIQSDTSYGIYNDAYWCGYQYFELHKSLHKPFSFIFLKLPLAKMIELYLIYHEMDFSSLLDYFDMVNKRKTILRLLCEQKGCSLTELSAKTGVNKATLSKYNASDDSIYKGSLENIYKIAKYFDYPISLFVR